MAEPRKDSNLARVKTMLAEKYERMAALCSSRPRRKSWKLRAERYRRQAQQAGAE